jgi:hypothetical protein
MENGDELSSRVDGNVYRKIAERNLLADWAQKPLVGQPHRAIGLLAWQIDLTGFRNPPFR